MSCNGSEEYETATPVGGKIKIKKIDDCEYLIYETGYVGSQSYSFSITHKGNCSNPIHRCEK